jgi:hypothetical protein
VADLLIYFSALLHDITMAGSISVAIPEEASHSFVSFQFLDEFNGYEVRYSTTKNIIKWKNKWGFWGITDKFQHIWFGARTKRQFTKRWKQNVNLQNVDKSKRRLHQNAHTTERRRTCLG